MPDDACDWTRGKVCTQLDLADTCVWTTGKECSQATYLETLRQRFEHGYWASFRVALTGSAITCIIFMSRAIRSEETWDAFWSDPQIWVGNTIGWPVVCLLIASAIPRIEIGELRTFFLTGLTLPGFIYALLGLGVETWAAGAPS